MFRRFAATLLAVLVLAVVSATPAVAKNQDKKDGSSPVTTGQGPTSGGDQGNGTGSGGAEGSNGDGSSAGAGDDGSSKGHDQGKGSDKGDETPSKKKTPSPSPRPSHTASSTSSSPGDASVAPASSDRSVVRAAAAPAATNTGVTALLPAPDPLLLPDSSTTGSSRSVAAPVDVERPSSLPQALPTLLVAAALLSVAVFGTLLARRRIARPHTASSG